MAGEGLPGGISASAALRGAIHAATGLRPALGLRVAWSWTLAARGHVARRHAARSEALAHASLRALLGSALGTALLGASLAAGIHASLRARVHAPFRATIHASLRTVFAASAFAHSSTLVHASFATHAFAALGTLAALALCVAALRALHLARSFALLRRLALTGCSAFAAWGHVALSTLSAIALISRLCTTLLVLALIWAAFCFTLTALLALRHCITQALRCLAQFAQAGFHLANLLLKLSIHFALGARTLAALALPFTGHLTRAWATLGKGWSCHTKGQQRYHDQGFVHGFPFIFFGGITSTSDAETPWAGRGNAEGSAWSGAGKVGLAGYALTSPSGGGG